MDGPTHLPGVGRTEQPGESDSLTRARHGAPNSHLDRPTAVVVPVVLPQAVVTVDDSGHARIALDNLNRHDRTDCPDGPISRDELGAVLAGIAEQIGGPVRVEIREPDGSRYADILQPRAPEPTEAPEPSEPSTAKPLLAGGGFLPEETVLVAVVVTTTQARPDGTASLTVLPSRERSGGEVILFGGASGRVVRRQLPRPLVAHKRRWWRR
jgi:hypothetical protein